MLPGAAAWVINGLRVMMGLMMGLNELMVLLERHALRWRAEVTTSIQTY
jgi:hypothetical protein